MKLSAAPGVVSKALNVALEKSVEGSGMVSAFALAGAPAFCEEAFPAAGLGVGFSLADS